MDLEIRRGVEVVVAIAVVLFGGIVFKLFRDLIWKPFAFQNAFAVQGIRGPSYYVLAGNIPEMRELLIQAAEAEPMKEISHDILPTISPHFHKWSKIYGETFFYWYGTQSRLYTPEPELAKEVLSTKFGYYEKSKPRPLVIALIGNGLVFVTGLQWVKQRRIVSPVFNVEKLKSMVNKMAACALPMLEKWQETVAQGDTGCEEIDVHSEFIALTADIISHTAFGSSYVEGKEVFELQRELQEIAAESVRHVHIPGSQYIPTSKNRYTWKIDRRVKEILKSVIQSRLHPKMEGTDVGYGNDLLGIMMTANKKALSGNQRNLSMTIDEIMEECKTFFFAGHETTSNLLTWTLFLLAINPEWQEYLRNEVINVCGRDFPDADKLSSLKLMTMVIYETLRLYPPGIMMIRKALEEIKLRNFLIPKGAEVVLPILEVHHSKKFWGEDANIFKPERFSEGVANASSHPNAFIPFSMGPRSCVGQNFALMEAKVALCMILQRFSFTLSPSYKHAPRAVLTLQPKYGMQIILKRIEL